MIHRCSVRLFRALFPVMVINMTENPQDQSKDDELAKRLKRLKSNLEGPDSIAAEAEQDERTRADRARSKAGIAQAFRLSSEFIAGVVVGGGIGYAIDTFFETSPWGLIIFLLLGFAAAVLNVLRAAGMVAQSEMSLKTVQEHQKRTDKQDQNE